MQGSEELFSIDPLPARTISNVTNNRSGSLFLSRPHTPVPTSARTERIHEQIEEELAAVEPEGVTSILADSVHK